MQSEDPFLSSLSGPSLARPEWEPPTLDNLT